MQGDELVLGGNSAQAIRIMDEHNRLAAITRKERATTADEIERFTDEYWQQQKVAKSSGNLLTRSHRYYLAPAVTNETRGRIWNDL